MKQLNTPIKNAILLLVFTTLSILSFARTGFRTSDILKGSEITTNKYLYSYVDRLSATVQNSQYTAGDWQAPSVLPTSLNNWKFINTKADLKLEITDEAKANLPLSFTCTIGFELKRYTSTGVYQTIPGGIRYLTVNYNKNQGLKYNQADVFQTTDLLLFSAKIVSISNPSVVSFLRISSTMNFREVAPFPTSNPFPLIKINADIINNGVDVGINFTFNDNALLNWTDSIELEWVWVDPNQKFHTANLLTDGTFLGLNNGKSLIYNFDEAVRVILPFTGALTGYHYKIPNVFEKGFVLFRARPIGVSFNTNTNQIIKNFGNWSALESGETRYFNNQAISDEAYIEVTDNYANKLNWQFKSTYAEDGKRRDEIQYYDGLFKTRQTIVRSSSDLITFVKEDIYDFQSRPGVEMIPVPTNEYNLNFRKGFTRASSTEDFMAVHLDDDPTDCSINPAYIHESSAAAIYYSNQNPWLQNANLTSNIQFIPKSSNAANDRFYPFIMVDYLKDNSGRIASKSMPGYTHRLGSIHATEYFYVKPSQEEIDRLFGEQIGFAEHYTKEVVKDPNGQLSISIKNLSGKVVATYLTGNSTENTLPLASNGESQVIQVDLLNGPQLVNAGPAADKKELLLSSHFFVDKAGDYQFKYSLNPETYASEVCSSEQNVPFCLDCVYDLEISVLNNCGEEQITIQEPNTAPVKSPIRKRIGDSQLNKTCGNGYSYATSDDARIANNSNEFFTVPLQVGSYQVIRKLVINDEALTSYKKQILEAGFCKTESDFINEELAKLTNDECNPCIKYQSIKNNLAQSKQVYITEKLTAFEIPLDPNAPNYTVEYNKWAAEFDKQFEELQKSCEGEMEPCKASELVLMADMRPDGLYGVNAANSTNPSDYSSVNFNTIERSFFNPTNYNTTANPNNRLVLSYKDLAYFHNNSIANSQNTNVKLSELSPADLVSNWKNEFSKELLPLHPEFVRILFCNGVSTSKKFDDRMAQIVKFDIALNETFLKTTGAPFNIALDPFSSIQAPYTNSVSVSNFTNAIQTNVLPLVNSADYNSLFSNENISLFQLTAYLVFCKDISSNDLPQILNCINSKTITSISNCRVETRDLFWNTYKGLYLSLKAKFYETSFNYYLSTNPTYPVQIYVNNISQTYSINLVNSYSRISPSVQRLTLPSTAPSSTFVSGKLTEQTQNCNEVCASYADTWMNQLSDCNFGNNATLKQNVRNALILVCQNGCDGNNPFGASTVKPSSTQTIRSFKDVLEFYQIKSTTCNESFLSVPGPYNSNWHTKLSENEILSTVSDCGTKVVNNLIYGGFNANFTGFCNENHAGLTQLAIAAKVEDDNCPADSICRTCADLEKAYRSFYLTNEVLETASNFSKTLTDYLNIKLDYTLTNAEYLNFFQNCSDEPMGLNLTDYLKQFRLKYLIYKKDQNGFQVASNENSFPVFASLNEANKAVNPLDKILNESLENSRKKWQESRLNIQEAPLLAMLGESNFIEVSKKQNFSFFPLPSSNTTPVPLTNCACDELTRILELTPSSAVTTALSAVGLTLEQANNLKNICEKVKNDLIDPLDPTNPPTEAQINEALKGDFGQGALVPCNLCPSCNENSNGEGTPIFPIPDPCGVFTTALNAYMSSLTPPLTNPNDLLNQPNINSLSILYDTIINRDVNKKLIRVSPVNLVTLTEWFKMYIEHCYNFPSGGSLGGFRPDPFYGGIGNCIENCFQAGTIGPVGNQTCGKCLAPNDKLLALQIYLNKLANVGPKQSLVNINCSGKFYQINNLAKIHYYYNPNVPEFYSNTNLYNGSSLTTLKHIASKSNHNGPVQFLSLQIKDANGFEKNVALSMAKEPGMLNNFSVIVGFDNIEPVYDPRYLCPGPTNHFRVQVTISTYNLACEPILIKRWVSGTYSDVITEELANCNVKKSYRICKFKGDPCQKKKEFLAKQNARVAYQNYVNQMMENIEKAYLLKCISAASANRETFVMKFTSYAHHYTLYYYDAAGNLVQTVPPAGVKPLTSASDIVAVSNHRKTPNPSNTVVQPSHLLRTQYTYNTLNQLVYQKTPDAGVSRFAYDRVGRLILSQNAKQAKAISETVPKYLYSYTLYDALGRITEVGQIDNQQLYQADAFVNNAVLESSTQVEQLLVNPSSKTEITRTYYDVMPSGLVYPYDLKNHNNRVAATAFYANYTNSFSNADHVVLYGYDERGNVDLLVRYTRSLIPLNQQFKAVQYRFDQLSGKVNEVIFQEAKPDQYVHHYEYDAENRLVKSYSSTRLEAIHESSIDGLRPGLDAGYAYYLHGPLARTELGEIKVQGVDYAYTMMGWLKTVNSDKLLPANDMGKDGYAGSFGATNYASDFPKDEIGFSLHYYDGDYQAIASSGGSGDIALQRAFVNSNAPYTNLPYGTNAISPELFNGNISRMITSIAQFNSPGVPLVSAYKYDQLNRLASAEYYHMNASTAALTSTQAWKNTFTYDANGNILSQKRNGNTTQTNMDDLRYFYKAYDVSNGNTQVIYTVNNQTGGIENASGLPYANGQLELTNQLSYVSDNTTYANNYTDDIDNQNNSFNYQYDEIGNLTKDISEEIDKIEWTVYGKIKRITRTTSSTKPDLEFEYTPDGHRAVKIVIPKNNAMRTYTYYVRDAQGNIMATYSRNFQKTIDYANLTYSQVNNSLIAKTSVESFAWFMANAHSAGAPGFVAALKADILASGSNTDWFLNHSSFNPELVLNAESDLGNRVWFNYDRLELFNMVKNTSILTFDHLCNCMKNRKLENDAPNYKSFIEHILSKPKLREAYMAYIYENQNTLYVDFYNKMGVDMVDFPTDLANLISEISSKGISTIGGHWLSANYYEDCASHFTNYQGYLYTNWHEDMGVELSQIEDFNEIFQNTNEDNFDFGCEEMGLPYLFSLLNSQNTTTLRNTMINQVQGSGISTEQQKKTWLINWYFANDPMGSIYLATLRNPSIVASYQTTPGLLYGSTFTQSMENYFIKIKNHFGQSMFDQLVTEFAQQSNLYVDEIKLDEFHIYGSSRLGVYESNKLISKRVARDLNLDNQITSNEYVIETPEEVTYLFSSYQLERGAKRYELANHLGNVLTVISDKKTAICTGNTFNYFTAERISATDYSPFGAPLAGRTWNGGEYRFGFNTQEHDDEIAGVGNIMTAQFWEYDSRLGRRWNVDPKPRFGISNYSTFGNNPNFNVDPNGDYFFGLFGSTKEQRKAAEELQKLNGGEIKSYHSKNISVNYTSCVGLLDNESNMIIPTIINKTVHFTAEGTPSNKEPLSINIDKWIWNNIAGSTYGELSGNDNSGNDRQYNPDGLQFSLGGNLLNYSASINLTYLKNDGVAVNGTYSDEQVSTNFVSLSPIFTEITFTNNLRSSQQEMSMLEGNGQNQSATCGPLSIASGKGLSAEGNTLFTTFSFGFEMPGRLNKFNKPAINSFGAAIENNVTSKSIYLIKFNKNEK